MRVGVTALNRAGPYFQAPAAPRLTAPALEAAGLSAHPLAALTM
jgi:hypothetical protein